MLLFYYDIPRHLFFFFFFNDTAPTEISPLPLHAALPILACLTAALMAVPVAAVVIQAVSVGTAEAVRVLHRPLLPTLLVHTVQLTVLVGMGCAVVGVGAAWAVERTDLPGRRVFRLLLALPLAVPEFVAAFGWLSI